jgi:hypothetical protein
MPIYVSMQLTLCDFKASYQQNLLSGYFEYRYADHGIIEIDDEEDWENFKEVMNNDKECYQ